MAQRAFLSPGNVKMINAQVHALSPIMTAAQRNRHQSEIAEIENEIAAGGLQLDIQTPR
jgi:hypothetical protein